MAPGFPEPALAVLDRLRGRSRYRARAPGTNVVCPQSVPGLPEPAPAGLASVPELTKSVLVLGFALVLVLVVVLVLVLILVPGLWLLSWSWSWSWFKSKFQSW